MRRELRANLIFFAILIPLLVPGFLILMNKKLSGTSEPNYMPEALPSSAAYVQPPPIPPRVPRVEPPRVRQWVSELLAPRVSALALLARNADDTPVVSDGFRVQLLHASPDRREVRLLVWDKRDAADATVTLGISTDSSPVAAKVSGERIDVPREVRRALQNAGYVDPPTRITLLTATFAPAGEADSDLVRIRLDDKSEERINLPKSK